MKKKHLTEKVLTMRLFNLEKMFCAIIGSLLFLLSGCWKEESSQLQNSADPKTFSTTKEFQENNHNPSSKEENSELDMEYTCSEMDDARMLLHKVPSDVKHVRCRFCGGRHELNFLSTSYLYENETRFRRSDLD